MIEADLTFLYYHASTIFRYSPISTSIPTGIIKSHGGELLAPESVTPGDLVTGILHVCDHLLKRTPSEVSIAFWPSIQFVVSEAKKIFVEAAQEIALEATEEPCLGKDTSLDREKQLLWRIYRILTPGCKMPTPDMSLDDWPPIFDEVSARIHSAVRWTSTPVRVDPAAYERNCRRLLTTNIKLKLVGTTVLEILSQDQGNDFSLSYILLQRGVSTTVYEKRTSIAEIPSIEELQKEVDEGRADWKVAAEITARFLMKKYPNGHYSLPELLKSIEQDEAWYDPRGLLKS